MVISMTGFGRAVLNTEAKNLTADVRTLNSKQLDVIIKAPSQYKAVEPIIRKKISELLQRGKIEVTITEEQLGHHSAKLNTDLLKAYALQLKEVASELELQNTDVLGALMRVPELVSNNEISISDDEVRALEKLVDEVCHHVNDFRRREGEQMATDFDLQVKCITEKSKAVEQLLPIRTERVKERLWQNVSRFLPEGKEIDVNRFEQEMIYYLEKMDVNEELVRLASHCQLFLEELKSEVRRKGKKMSFIAQEMGREINTIGSKANDNEMQALVIEMKDALEKIKEQLMNVL